MEVAVQDAQGQLDEPVRLAEESDQVVLTRHGRPSVRLVPVERTVTRADRRASLAEVRRTASGRTMPGASAARSQDDLSGEDSLPLIVVNMSVLMAILLG